MLTIHKSALPFTTTSILNPLVDELNDMEFALGNEYIELRHVLGPFPAPILITSADANIIYVNPAWEQLTGYTIEDVKGKNPRFLKSGKTDKKIFTKMWKSLLQGKVFTSENIIDKRKDGTEFYTNSIIFPIKYDEKPIFYVQLELDITNRKRLEDLKREFLSTATHELKTPITALKLLIQSMLQKLLRKELNKVSARELKMVDKELDRLTHIVEDLSDVSRIEAGKLRMNMQIVNISYIIKEALHQMRSLANGHKLKSQLLLPIYVIADEGRIKQVLINLIKNALKYSYEKSEIVISTTIQNDHCVISVQNDGSGIPKNKIPLIFDRFFQLQLGTNTGLGLGLYISKKIIQQHKGKIWVKSVVNKQTTFYFSLIIADNKKNGGEA